MCDQCDYNGLLEDRGLENTTNRLRILEIIGNSSYPLSAHEIYETLSRTRAINRVTVYRILELLVEKQLAERLSADDRSFRYGLAPNENHSPHPHFYCRACKSMECLSPRSLDVNLHDLQRTFPGLIQKTELRLDGICKNCLRNLENDQRPTAKRVT